jgi:hypothetical protein
MQVMTIGGSIIPSGTEISHKSAECLYIFGGIIYLFTVNLLFIYFRLIHTWNRKEPGMGGLL